MKRKLFIGSSSEGLPVARQIENQIKLKLGSWLAVDVWKDNEIFTLNKGTLESLVHASRSYDYGILVATNDDLVESRAKQAPAPRDNVIFEMGLFLGSLGLTRAFLVLEKNGKPISDYNGVTVPTFDSSSLDSISKSGELCINAIESTHKSFNFKPMPSVALAVGYFDNFIMPIAKKKLEANVDFTLEVLIPTAVHEVQAQIINHKRSNPSSEVSVFQPDTRPIVNKYNDHTERYWDIPTTLNTLNRLMDYMLPAKEVGQDNRRQAWIEHELRNFSGTIEVLVDQNIATRGRVRTAFLI